MKIFGYSCIISSLLISCIGEIYATIEVEPPTDILPQINYISNSGDDIAKIISWFIGLTAILAVIAITWAGIQMVLAVGEDERFKKARYTMIYAFVGLLIAGIAYAVVNSITHLNLGFL